MDFSDSIWNLILLNFFQPKGMVGQKTYCKIGGKTAGASSDSRNSFHLFNESKKSES
jgi:hypothetical protein